MCTNILSLYIYMFVYLYKAGGVVVSTHFPKHKKPFTDSEIVKECMLETVKMLFDDKMKSEIKEKINRIPLSDSTSMRRTELLAYDLMSQLDEGLRNAPGIH